MLKLNNITSEGVRSDEPIEVRLKDNDSGAPTGCVFTFRPGTNKEWEKAQNRHVRFVKNDVTKAMEDAIPKPEKARQRNTLVEEYDDYNPLGT